MSVDNLKRIGATMEGFLYDTYHIQLKDVYSFSEFETILQEMMERVEANAPKASLADKNKQVMVLVRNRLMENPSEMPTPVERTATKTEEPEDAFFQKLQELEQRRKVPPQPTVVAPPAPVSTPTAPPPIPPSPSVSLPPAPPPAVAPQEHVIVAVPPPPRQGIPYVISSWDRNLQDHPERAVVYWKSPLPGYVDPMGTSISGLFLPSIFTSYTPYLFLVMEGVGGNQTSCFLTPENPAVHRTRGWSRWIPMSHNLSYIRNLSTPWVIHLKAADGSLLPLGLDHFQVISIEVDVSNRMAELRLGSILPTSSPISLTESDFQVGEQIWIYTKSDKKKTEVLSVSKDTIQVRYISPAMSITMSNAIHEWFHARVMNYSRQWSMILDLTRTSIT